MSHIPNSAIPHATANDDEAPAKPSKRARAAELAGQARTKVKEHPKTAIAAGAAVVAGAVAAAAIPLVKARRKSSGGTAKAKGAPKSKQG